MHMCLRSAALLLLGMQSKLAFVTSGCRRAVMSQAVAACKVDY